MMRILQAKWTAVAVGTLVYGVTTWFCLQPEQQLSRAARTARSAPAEKAAVPVGPSWTFENPELTKLIAELKDEREALRAKASQLEEWEARLAAERKEIYAVTQNVYQLRQELDTMVTRVTEEEAVNLKKLAKVYTTMTPEGAAHILKEMEDEQIVKILTLMREADSGRILENLGQGSKDDAKRAALLLNRLRLTMAATKKTPAS